MRTAFWEQLAAEGYTVPTDEPLADLTAELTVMLGSPDPHVREDLAAGTVTAWISLGVYDELLTGLGDGLVAGLRTGLGEEGTDTVFRRSCSALLLAGCLERDSQASLVGPDTVLRWGDALMSWFVRERDLDEARALDNGAVALAALAGSPSLGEPELVAVLDVLADRLTAPTPHRLTHVEADRLARCTVAVARRGLVGDAEVEGWLDRLVQLTRTTDDGGVPTSSAANAESLLRALHLQVAVGARPPENRSDLLLAVLAALRASNGDLLR